MRHLVSIALLKTVINYEGRNDYSGEAWKVPPLSSNPSEDSPVLNVSKLCATKMH